MKHIILSLLLLIFLSGIAYANDSLKNSSIKASIQVQSLNYIGNFSGISIEYSSSYKISYGLTVSYMHNRAEIPRHDFIKIQHRFYGESLSDRVSPTLHVGYNINGAFFKFGEVQTQLSLGYMNATYRNRWFKFSHFDNNGLGVYDIINIKNKNINCVTLTGGLNIKSDIIKNIFINSSMGVGIIYMTGFSPIEMSKSSFIKPNYNLSIGIGYRYRIK